MFMRSGGHAVGTAATRFYHMVAAASATGEYEKVCHGKKFELHLFVYIVQPVCPSELYIASDLIHNSLCVEY